MHSPEIGNEIKIPGSSGDALMGQINEIEGDHVVATLSSPAQGTTVVIEKAHMRADGDGSWIVEC